jgi:hypothetical protein
MHACARMIAHDERTCPLHAQSCSVMLQHAQSCSDMRAPQTRPNKTKVFFEHFFSLIVFLPCQFDFHCFLKVLKGTMTIWAVICLMKEVRLFTEGILIARMVDLSYITLSFLICYQYHCKLAYTFKCRYVVNTHITLKSFSFSFCVKVNVVE